MVAGRPYTPDVPRILAVGLGCVVALGMQALFGAFVGGVVSGVAAMLVGYVALFVALGLGGFVTGHFVGHYRVAILYGALVAIVYILLTATFQATRDAILAHELGSAAALPPIDFVQLTLTDVLAMTGASCGAWLASQPGKT
jgi:hypothetical protein